MECFKHTRGAQTYAAANLCIMHYIPVLEYIPVLNVKSKSEAFKIKGIFFFEVIGEDFYILGKSLAVSQAD